MNHEPIVVNLQQPSYEKVKIVVQILNQGLLKVRYSGYKYQI